MEKIPSTKELKRIGLQEPLIQDIQACFRFKEQHIANVTGCKTRSGYEYAICESCIICRSIIDNAKKAVDFAKFQLEPRCEACRVNIKAAREAKRQK